MDRTLSIVVPIFNAPEALAPCLAALQKTVPDNYRVVLIDDASTDTRIGDLLDAVQAERHTGWQVIRSPRNRGFVATANHGMRLAQQDVILLNSDTVVTEGWVERMIECAASHERAGTITPLTNNGEIASIPEFCRANPVPSAPDRIARALAGCGPALNPEIPTAVGFCMYITRRALDAVGYFDRQTFGLGYGEENDFSMRVAKAGLQNLLCDSAYVVHVGNQSFGPLGLAADQHAMDRLLGKHPEYLDLISDFIRRDPFGPRRREIVASLRRQGVDLA